MPYRSHKNIDIFDYETNYQMLVSLLNKFNKLKRGYVITLTLLNNKLQAMSIYRNLEDLQFTIWKESQTVNDPLCTGSHRDMVKYLEENGAEGLKVGGICMETSFSFDPMTAKKWLEWYDHLVIPALKENNWDDDLEIEYPVAGVDLTTDDDEDENEIDGLLDD